MSNRPIYLDYQATTPVDEHVLSAMLPYFVEQFGNAHAQENNHGQRAASAIRRARVQVAALVGASERSVVFTSGATEANNLLIRGAARKGRDCGRPGIIMTAIEHKAVLEVIEALGREGHPIKVLPVDSNGLVDPHELEGALDETVGLVSLMAANNEIGVTQPLTALGSICRQAGVVFHTDAAQAAGKIPLDLESMKIDLLSISAHKLYGPQGIGAAIGSPKLLRQFDPLFAGGGQEAGLRPGIPQDSFKVASTCSGSNGMPHLDPRRPSAARFARGSTNPL